MKNWEKVYEQVVRLCLEAEHQGGFVIIEVRRIF